MLLLLLPLLQAASCCCWSVSCSIYHGVSFLTGGRVLGSPTPNKLCRARATQCWVRRPGRGRRRNERPCGAPSHRKFKRLKACRELGLGAAIASRRNQNMGMRLPNSPGEPRMCIQ